MSPPSVRLGVKGHVPGQQLVDAAEGMIGDTAEHLAQPAFRIDAVEAGRSQQRIDGSCVLTACVGRQFIMPEF